jgi:hypothetical protein
MTMPDPPELAPAGVPVTEPGLLLVLLPLEHAAARTATAAAPPTPAASFAAGDIRFTMEVVICVYLPSSAVPPRQ